MSRERRVARQALDELAAVVGVERCEVERVLREGRAQVAQLGTREREDQRGGAAAPRDEVLDEIEQRRLGPVEVVEDDEQRAFGGERLQEAPHRPERLLRGERRAEAQHPRERVSGLVVACHRGELGARDRRLVAVGDPRAGPQGLGDGQERGALARGLAAAVQHASAAVQRGGELGGQPRLADPRRADDRQQPERARRDRVVEGLHRALQLVGAPDERHLERHRSRAVDLAVDDAPRG